MVDWALRDKRAARIADVHSRNDTQRGAAADRGVRSTIEAACSTETTRRFSGTFT